MFPGRFNCEHPSRGVARPTRIPLARLLSLPPGQMGQPFRVRPTRSASTTLTNVAASFAPLVSLVGATLRGAQPRCGHDLFPCLLGRVPPCVVRLLAVELWLLWSWV